MKMRDKNLAYYIDYVEQVIVHFLYHAKGICVCKGCCDIRIKTKSISDEVLFSKAAGGSIEDLIRLILTNEEAKAMLPQMKSKTEKLKK